MGTKKLTPSRRQVLREAAAHIDGLWRAGPTSGDHRMAKRLAADGFGTWHVNVGTFVINDAGRARLKAGGE